MSTGIGLTPGGGHRAALKDCKERIKGENCHSNARHWPTVEGRGDTCSHFRGGTKKTDYWATDSADPTSMLGGRNGVGTGRSIRKAKS